jgi:hypothetical protein
MRIREPKTTALIFASGKMVVTGAKSEDDSRLAARKYARIVQKLGFDAQFKDFKIQNIVASCDVKFPVRLEGLAYAHGNFSSYEPELFPGLIYRMHKPKVVLLIFVSGKIVLTGAKVRSAVCTLAGLTLLCRPARTSTCPSTTFSLSCPSIEVGFSPASPDVANIRHQRTPRLDSLWLACWVVSSGYVAPIRASLDLSIRRQRHASTPSHPLIPPTEAAHNAHKPYARERPPVDLGDILHGLFSAHSPPASPRGSCSVSQ